MASSTHQNLSNAYGPVFVVFLTVVLLLSTGCDGLFGDLPQFSYSGETDCTIDDECPDNQECIDGICIAEGLECDDGYQPCGAICIDVMTHDGHCSGCNIACRADQYCNNGHCECIGDLESCQGQCVDTTSNPDYCGGCNQNCEADEVCYDGECTNEGCPEGTTDCDGACVDTYDSIEHCLDCNNRCDEPITGAEPVCTLEGCNYVCNDSSKQICAGECVDISSNVHHCGECGNSCDDGDPSSCTAGSCDTGCPGGTTECDEKCVDTSSHSEHCGGCDDPCGGDEWCINETCTTTAVTYQTVDFGEYEVGRAPSIAVDTNDNPHISYSRDYDNSRRALKYAHRDSVWQTETLETDISLSSYEVPSSLVVDSDDTVHIVFVKDFDIGYAHNGDGSWNSETIITPTSGGSGGSMREEMSLAIDDDDILHLTYALRTSGSEYRINYATSDDDWSVVHVAEHTDLLRHPSVAVDADGLPHISYVERNDGESDTVQYAHYNGSDWTFETVVTEPPELHSETHIAVDVTGAVHLLFRDFDNWTLIYAYRDPANGSWSTDDFLGGTSTNRRRAFGVDGAGRPHVVYSTSSQIEHARKEGDTWDVITVADGITTPFLSLDIDSDNNPHIAIGDPFDDRLEYAKIGAE